MKSPQLSLKLVGVLAVCVAVVVVVSQRGVRSPEVAASETPITLSTSVAETVDMPKTTTAVPAAPKIQAPALEGNEVVPSAGELAELALAARGDEAELAYQLGMDISKLSAEARARLKADWEAHLKLARSEVEVAQ